MRLFTKENHREAVKDVTIHIQEGIFTEIVLDILE